MDFALMPMSQSLPPDSNIIFTKPAEGLASNIKVAFLSSFIATMPLIIYEAWSFVKPALYENENNFSFSGRCSNIGRMWKKIKSKV